MMMPYENLLADDTLRRHDLSPQQLQMRIGEMMALTEEHLDHAEASGLTFDAHHNFAYAAARVAAEAIMLAAGYRPGRRYGNHVAVLKFLGRADDGKWCKLADRLDLARRHRNVAEYERPGTISATELAEMRQIARQFCRDVRDWLWRNHPDLLPPPPPEPA
jgi:hypothetical protein